MYAKKGFTLIELLVVIAIMAILFVGVVVMLNPLERMQEARDSKRIQLLQSVRTAIDIALTDGEITLAGTPQALASGNSKAGTTATDGTGWVKVATVTGKVGLSKYLPTLPSDPSGAAALGDGLEWVSNGTTYEVKTTFETAKYTADFAATDGGGEALKYEVGTNPGLGL
ncbi:type II secretion system protein [Patescibacteria group bacterium]|nr:type II secretion system protein [Patescibacteria group bacterium]